MGEEKQQIDGNTEQCDEEWAKFELTKEKHQEAYERGCEGGHGQEHFDSGPTDAGSRWSWWTHTTEVI